MSNADELLYNPEAEKSALGGLLIDPAAWPQVAGLIRADDFWLERHGWVFEAMAALRRNGTGLDFVTLCDELERRGKLEAVGGPAYLTQLFTATPTSMHVGHYASIVARLSTSRRLVQAATRMAQLAHDQSLEVDEVFIQARGLLDAVAPLDLGRAVVMWRDSLEWYLEAQEERLREVEAERAGERLERLRFPWRALQRRVRWIRPGMMVLVAAESGVGKTVFLECCAERWAQEGYRVAFFHFELSHQVMWDRRACRQTGASMEELEEGVLDERLTRASADLYNWPGGVHYVHCPGWSMARVVATARQLAARGECDAVVVDYLQKAFLPAKSAGLTPAQVRGQQVEALKTLGEQLEMPVLLASQMNRTSQMYGRKTRFSIRDTGEADEKANVVLLLDRVVLDTPQDMSYALDEEELVEVSVPAGEFSPVLKVRTDKNTLGPTGDDELLMDAPRFWILDREDATVGARPLGWEERMGEAVAF